ncbi:hypothetical protein [Micromonospora psammae]|uniref:hypothetical protein n=1 Tax=Micromonospora sp. CPCC 205556 TaxID=3122398 RepID=UPI002FEFA7F3
MSALWNLSNRLYLTAVIVSVVAIAIALTQGAGGDTGTALLAEGFGWIEPDFAVPDPS